MGQRDFFLGGASKGEPAGPLHWLSSFICNLFTLFTTSSSLGHVVAGHGAAGVRNGGRAGSDFTVEVSAYMDRLSRHVKAQGRSKGTTRYARYAIYAKNLDETIS